VRSSRRRSRLAERRRASARRSSRPFVAGVEIEAKLGRALNPALYEIGWHATGVLGIFGAAAAAAKLLGLSTERTAHALASRVHGERHQGELRDRLQAAARRPRRAVRNRSGLLAEAGFTGNPRPSSTATASGHARHRQSPGLGSDDAGLGSPHDLVDPGIGVSGSRPAPARTALDATLALAEEHAIDRRVVSVECGVNYMAPHQLIYDQPRPGSGQVLDAVLVSSRCSIARWDSPIRRGACRRSDREAFMRRYGCSSIRIRPSRESCPRGSPRWRSSSPTPAPGEERAAGEGPAPASLSDAELTTKFHDCAARVLSRERRSRCWPRCRRWRSRRT